MQQKMRDNLSILYSLFGKFIKKSLKKRTVSTKTTSRKNWEAHLIIQSLKKGELVQCL